MDWLDCDWLSWRRATEEGRSVLRAAVLVDVLASAPSSTFLLMSSSRSLRPLRKLGWENSHTWCSGCAFCPRGVLLHLWKPYIFSCLTKELKLECLKWVGKISEEKRERLATIKLSPARFHEIRLLVLASTISYSFGTKDELAPCFDFLEACGDSSSDSTELSLFISFLFGCRRSMVVGVARVTRITRLMDLRT